MKIIIAFLIIALAISFSIVTVAFLNKNLKDSNNQYCDEDGNHVYYDRSIIEKKKFMKKYPEEAKTLRSFKRFWKK